MPKNEADLRARSEGLEIVAKKKDEFKVECGLRSAYTRGLQYM